MAGSGKLNVSGSVSKEPVRVAFDYFKANAGRVSTSIHPTEKDYTLHMVELQSSGTPEALTLTSFIALCSAALGKPVQGQLAVLGDMTLGGTITQSRNLAESMQVAFDAGAKRILLPMSSVTDIPSVPGELFAKSDEFLFGPGGCGVQGAGGGVRGLRVKAFARQPMQQSVCTQI